MLNRRQFVASFGAVAAVWLWAHSALLAEDESPVPAAEPASRKACILIWLDGGPSTIDMWDMKKERRNDGPFRAITTAGEMESCEHFPKIARVMDKLSIVRSMTGRGTVGERAYEYMHTSFVPNPNCDHPSVGSVIARELGAQRPELKLPGFVSINGPGMGSGYLGPRYAPLVIDSRRELIRHANLAIARNVLGRPTDLLNAIDGGFDLNQTRQAREYREFKQQTMALLQSNQLDVFDIDDESPILREAYGVNEFGDGLLMARRLVEAGVPFVEVALPGWDVREDYYDVLRCDLYPKLDAGVSILVRDLESRGLLKNTVIIVTGGFARVPRLKYGFHDHWSRNWSLVVGGGGITGGIVVGRTSPDGTRIETQPHTPQDLWATVGLALGISPDTRYTTRSGRQTRIFNSGRPIKELLDH